MTKARTLRLEGVGLLALVATLFAYAAVVGIVLQSERDHQLRKVMSHRESVVRVLASSLAYKLVAPATRHSALLQVRYSENTPLFLYAGVTDARGETLAKIGDVTLPVMAADGGIQDWTGAIETRLPATGERITEIRAPLFRDGNLAGYLRMGYHQPRFSLDLGRMRFFALLALPLFLLSGLLYFYIRRELSGLQRVSGLLVQSAKRQDFTPLRTVRGGAAGALAQRMHVLLQGMRDREREARAHAEDEAVANKILGYKRNRMESVLEALPDHIVVLDETGQTTFASSKIRNLFGLEAGEITGRKVEEWCDDEEIRHFLQRHEAHEAVGHSSEDYRFSPASAPEKTISITTYPLFSRRESNQLLGKLVLFHDVTAETLAAKSRADFVAHISHELKTPLNVLGMYSEGLLDNGEDSAFRDEACNVIHDEVERLATLINNLLSLTQFEMGSMKLDRQRVRLHDLLQDAFDNVARAGKDKNLQFELDLPKELTPIFVDKDLLRIAINNLLTNAIKYNREGGSVTLRAEETEDVIRVQVADTGIGIAPENWHRIFEKFYRVEDEEVRDRSGHGLGLPLALQIIQLHHGQLSVQSEPGQGTEFTLEFNKHSGLLRRANET